MPDRSVNISTAHLVNANTDMYSNRYDFGSQDGKHQPYTKVDANWYHTLGVDEFAE